MTESQKDTQRALAAAKLLIDGRDPHADMGAIMTTLEGLVALMLLVAMNQDRGDYILDERWKGIAALYVETDGCYFGLPGVDPWDEARDARLYAGSHPVVAHPPCQRWGRFWHGSTRKPHRFKLGRDQGCFGAALDALADHRGVLEHPCDSHAWKFFGMTPPQRHKGWSQTPAPFQSYYHFEHGYELRPIRHGGEWWTCYVEQGHYGHMSRKPTWLLTCGIPRERLPELDWSKGAQRLHPVALERYGYEKARRIGMTAMVGGKDKTRTRNATPIEFRDVLLGIASLARQTKEQPV